jgi:hypothetical protein
MPRPLLTQIIRVASWMGSLLLASSGVAGERVDEIAPLLQAYCIDCHGHDGAEAHINLEELIATPNYATRFRDWGKVATMVREQRMPPEDAAQPNDAERHQLADLILAKLDHIADSQAGDPGRVVLRRLTSGEYAYTIQDLTGLDLDLDGILIGDAVGGEGFANVGDVQFVQDSTLERYLEAARLVASHAVIGTGPLAFFHDPGKTGFELSAIDRIQTIYRRYGFRSAAGEGGEPFGLDLYPRAFYVAWCFLHRQALGMPEATLAELALNEGLEVRFAEHVWRVLTERSSSFPSSEIVTQWKQLVAPTSADAQLEQAVRRDCQRIAEQLREWQSRLAQNAGDDEEVSLLTDDSIRLAPKHAFRANLNWVDGAEKAAVHFFIDSATGETVENARVVWRRPTIQFQLSDRRRSRPSPLVNLLSANSAQRKLFGQQRDSVEMDDMDFVMTGVTDERFEFVVPAGAIAGRLTVEAELDTEHATGCIVRCTVRDGSEQRDTAASTGEISAMLGLPEGPEYESWKAGVLDFAKVLPEISHREPAPSDRDPIPAPFDNRYNTSERNDFHYSIKYHRSDDFLVKHILNDSARQQLDHAWDDLLSSFDYHDTYLAFIAEKFDRDLDGQTIATVHPNWIASLPDECRSIASELVHSYIEMQAAMRAAQPGHIEDAIQFARLSWRRPLTNQEEQRLREFYTEMRDVEQLGHVEAMRALLTRILVSPAFLYRVERPQDGSGTRPLSPSELASRLSYFLWSSPPDLELRRAAELGELSNEDVLVQQTKRMLRDPKARRFATEFFGQWFGFYRFDDYRGVDANRFAEFNPALKASMYAEAIAFFEHIVREDRPVREILFADYTFLNQDLARHYGLPEDMLADLTDQNRLVPGVNHFHRGGLLRLGAVQTVTSAPLRTSAVKRGDWILRRVLGTPVPPPPADAGSIPADEVSPEGKTVREQLIAHRRDSACVNCHSRMDPLGFAMENFDAIGRWRERYRGGQPIDASGTLHDGTHISGLDDLREYLQLRQPEFARTLCSKLLGYALGRSELLSDKRLMEQMMADIAIDGRFSQLANHVVTSRQFRSLGGHNTQSEPERLKGNEDGD